MSSWSANLGLINNPSTVDQFRREERMPVEVLLLISSRPRSAVLHVYGLAYRTVVPIPSSPPFNDCHSYQLSRSSLPSSSAKTFGNERERPVLIVLAQHPILSKRHDKIGIRKSPQTRDIHEEVCGCFSALSSFY